MSVEDNQPLYYCRVLAFLYYKMPLPPFIKQMQLHLCNITRQESLNCSFQRTFFITPAASIFGQLLRMNKKPGDWNCGSCNYLNFSRREMCQRCADPRPASAYVPPSSGSGHTISVLRGDWYCTCGYHNFASRANCLKCGASKSNPGGGANAENRPFLPGDWTCTRPGCNEHNFASRTECYGCNAPRESGKEN